MEPTDIIGGQTPEELLKAVYKQLSVVVGKTDERMRNANTLADAVKVSRCPAGLVGCNSSALMEATGGILNCPPLDVAPDPLIVDPFGVCYAPESLREEWKGKHVSIDDLIKEYSDELLLNLQNSNNLRRAMEEAARGATNRVPVNNMFTGSGAVDSAATAAEISPSQASAFLSVFSDKMSVESSRMLASFVTRGENDRVLWSLYAAMLFSRTSKASILRNFNTLGMMYNTADPNTLPYLAGSFLSNIGDFWTFSLKMIIQSAYSKVHDGYFVSVAAAKNSYEMLLKARKDVADARTRRPIAGGDLEGGTIEGGLITINVESIADLEKHATGAQKAHRFKQVELAEALGLAFSEESKKSVDHALSEMAKFAPSGDFTKKLGPKLLSGVANLDSTVKTFIAEGVALGATIPTESRRVAGVSGTVPAFFTSSSAPTFRPAPSAPRASLDLGGSGVGGIVSSIAAFPLATARGVVDAVGSAVGSISRGVGGVIGGYDDYDDDFYGGEDMSPAMRSFLRGGESPLRGGLAPPAHSSPESIRKATGYNHNETADEKKVRQQLAAKGYHVTMYDVASCPTSVNKTGNTYGNGNKWVETKNPWALCQAQMGYQFKTPHGFCYPEGMSCYDPENVKGARKALERTLDKAAIWQTLASTLNAIKRGEYEQWMTKKRTEIVNDPANVDISEKEIEEILKLHTPPKFKSLPNSMAVQTMVTVSAELANAMDEFNPKNDDKERKLLSEILHASGTFEASWRDTDLVRQDEKIDVIAENLVISAAKCTAESIKQHDAVPRVIKNVEGCSILDVGHGETAHVPSEIFGRIDMEKIEKGEPADPLVMWWRKYDHSKRQEHAKKFAKLRAALDPTNPIGSVLRDTHRHMAEKAVGTAARSALGSHM